MEAFKQMVDYLLQKQEKTEHSKKYYNLKILYGKFITKL